MPRSRAAVAAPPASPPEPTPTQINFELVKAYVTGQIQPEDELLAKEMREKIDMFDYVSIVLDAPSRDISTIRVYRLVPEITNEGPPYHARNKQPLSAIDLIPGPEFTLGNFQTRNGGGKYKFILKSKLERLEFEQIMDLPGSPRIYPHHKLVHPEDKQFCVMVDADNRSIVPGAAITPNGAGVKPVTQQDIPAIIEQATAAAKAGNAASMEAMHSAMELVNTGANKGMEIMAETLKRNVTDGGNSSVEQLRAEFSAKINELTNAIKDQRIAKLEQDIAALRDQRNNPARPAGSILDAGGQVAKELGVDGGLLGLAKVVVGGEHKEEGLMDYIGQGVREALKTWGGDAIMALREYLALRREESARAAGKAPAPSPSPQPVQRPQALPTAPAAATTLGPEAKPPTEMTEAEMFAELTREITGTIAQYITEMERWDGQAVAVVIKDKYREFLPFITKLEIFQDFQKLLAFCRDNPDLKEFSAVPEFEDFAQDFFNAFQPKKPAASVGTAATGGGTPTA